MSSHPVFTYGTLQIAPIMQAVTGSRFDGVRAQLPGFARYRIRQQVFPGIVPERGSTVPGVLYPEVDDIALQLLDYFEDELYERQLVDIQVDGENYRAQAYVVSPRFHGMLEKKPWDPARFRQMHLQRYLRSCRRFYHAHAPLVGRALQSTGR